uniref:Tetratricopeptide repeat protein 33 isoform X3 n=1 Tax=Petromyzon marinus TaxID=7757 RepID=A0AAJ7UFW1_PETMA|nr:tetratricopeptide repeat protein 33 isoform X3 [Petromyzon marinus]
MYSTRTRTVHARTVPGEHPKPVVGLTWVDSASNECAVRGAHWTSSIGEAMTSFGWVKRSGSVLKPRVSLGEDDDDDDSGGGGEVTLPIDKKRKHSQDGSGDGGGLGSDGDDGTSVTLRCCELRDEGARLAESGSLREALRLWDTAIAMTTNDAKIHEMKAQVLMELGEWFRAVQSAHRSISMCACWAPAWLTLARAQLNLGEPAMAVRSFSVGLHLEPWESEPIMAELRWAQQLQEQLQQQPPHTHLPQSLQPH